MLCRLVKIYRYKIHLLSLSYKNHAPTHIGRGNYCSYLSFPLLIATAPGDDIALPNTSFTSQIKNTITSTGIRHVVTISTASPSMNLLTMFFTLFAVTDKCIFHTVYCILRLIYKSCFQNPLLFLLSLSSSFDASDSSTKSFASSIVASIDSWYVL